MRQKTTMVFECFFELSSINLNTKTSSHNTKQQIKSSDLMGPLLFGRPKVLAATLAKTQSSQLSGASESSSPSCLAHVSRSFFHVASSMTRWGLMLHRELVSCGCLFVAFWASKNLKWKIPNLVIHTRYRFLYILHIWVIIWYIFT